MKTSKKLIGLSQTTIALAVFAAFSPAQAQYIGQLGQFVAPTNSVSLGVGVASGDEKDRARFGMFNGLREHSVNPLLGFNYTNTDNGSGKWTVLQGRNLGLDNQEFGLSLQRLGDWRITADYSEITRHDPRTINSGMVGAGTTTPTVVLLPAPGTGNDLNFELKRKAISVGGYKWFGGTFQAEFNAKSEDKDGTRFFGRGFACSATWVAAGNCTASTTQWALLMVPEPVDSNIKNVDGKLNFSAGNLFLSGAYYGSFYENSHGNLTNSVPATLLNPLGAPTAFDAGLRNTLALPMALWPDNEAHTWSLAGNYKFTPGTSMNFKYAFTHATQNENFLGMGLTGAPGGRSDLGGVVDRTKFQVGFSSHPLAKLHVHANLKYDKREDKTPIALYNIEGANPFTNGQYSPKRLDGHLEATYSLPANYSATAGVFVEKEDLGTFSPTVSVAGLSGLRQKLEETGARVELRKSMSETLNWWISYSSAKREGDSPWLKPASLPLTGVFEASPDCQSVGANACIFNRTAIFPFIFMDRKRDKVKLTASWDPMDRLSMTFFVEDGKDKYSGPTEHGLRDTSNLIFSADAAYKLSDAWKVNAYVSHGNQETNAGHSTGYDATLKDINNSFGIGLVGNLSERMLVGANVNYLNDRLEYNQTQDPLANAANTLFLAEQGGLPDVTYKLTTLRLFGEYAVQKNASVRLDLAHYRSEFNEWTYNFNGVPFFYSDNTTLTSKQDQKVTFVGASYIYRFR